MILASASVRVDEAPHLCRVQAATRELCRSAGLGEGEVFSTVIAATELAHRLFIEGERAGELGLSIVSRKAGLSLEVRPADAPRGAGAAVHMIRPNGE